MPTGRTPNHLEAPPGSLALLPKLVAGFFFYIEDSNEFTSDH